MSSLTVKRYEYLLVEAAKNGQLEDFDLYYAHRLFEVELTPKKQQIYNRYSWAMSLKYEGYSDSMIEEELMKGSPERHIPRCSQKTAYNAYRDAKILFGDVEKQNIALERKAAIEWYERKSVKVFEDAKEKLIDYDKAYKISIDAKNMAIKLRGLLEQDKNNVDAQAWQTQEFFMVGCDASYLEDNEGESGAEEVNGKGEEGQ